MILMESRIPKKKKSFDGSLYYESYPLQEDVKHETFNYHRRLSIYPVDYAPRHTDSTQRFPYIQDPG
jgi:hypothetical protein